MAVQKDVKNLRFTTTEPLEHAFGTARSWRREFTINEFLIYCNKLDIILKNVVEYDIRTCSSSKGYMHGFKGFAGVVSRIKNKLVKKSPVSEDNSWAVDVDYSGTPIIEQIQDKILGAIKRINTPILNLMKIFQM